jgi:UDP-N-acetylmuramoyl-tripeptide--D-alanyl-D-alanine ligase
MVSWDLGALARAAGSEVHGGALPERVAAVGTDSRSLPSASLFVALRGASFDGHDFVAQAAKQGAVAALVDRAGADRARAAGIPLLVVEDTLAGLTAMARWARGALARKVVGVTGSNGKTTTKEMVAAVLATRGAVHKTAGNLNNQIGLPLTLLAWPAETWAAVLEMGMSGLGEIAHLCEVARPDVGLITMVGPAHLEQLGTLENIARAKAELFAGLPATGVGVVNTDDALVQAMAVPLLGARPRVSFGRAADADVRVLGAVPRGTSFQQLELSVQGRALSAELPLPGSHNALNAAAAVAAGLALGVDPEAAMRALAGVAVPGGRMRVVERQGGVSYVDDSYNANPSSMQAGFETLRSLTRGRRLAVLGDMLELGPTTAALHREVGLMAARSGVDVVFALGPFGTEVAAGARAGGADGRAFADMSALLADLDTLLQPGDWVLVKGSRGMKMERAVAHLAEHS